MKKIEDPLNAARGILFGCLLSLPFWVLLFFLWRRLFG